MKPDFSLIIPCYKSENTIARSIGSILDQDFKNFEIICILDGEDKNAEEVIKTFPSVKYKVIEHGGACKARNEGFKMSEGQYVIFSDSDIYWRPGMFRKFKEIFDKRPDLDFIYGGYRWIDQEGAHIPHDFDPYLLTVANYIDTNNPVKREWVEKVGGFDESLKRFQDWDLWLRIIKAGAKGLRVEDITRDTNFPTQDSISGQKNYKESFEIIKNKHSIPDRKICVTSIAARQHALRVAKSCEWDFWHYPPMLPTKYDAIYLLGCFPEGIQDHVSLFMSHEEKHPRDCVYLIHWIGTDVLNMRYRLNWLDIKNVRTMFENRNVVHLVQSKENQQEMEELGFKVIHLPLPVENVFERSEFPKDFTIAVYDHEGIDDKWHKWLFMELTKAMPDIQWKFYGNRNSVGKDKNTEWLGQVPIKEVIKQSSVLMRLTIHDGYPVAPVEFMLSGRQVITNVKDMAFTHYIDLGVVNDDRVIEIKKKAIKMIREVQMNYVWSDEQFNTVKDHYDSLLSPVKFKEKIESLVRFQQKVREDAKTAEAEIAKN